MPFIRTFLLLLPLLLSSCASIPLTTLARLSTFDEQDFIALNADQLRVKSLISTGVRMNEAASKLEVTLTSKQGARHYALQLTQLSERTLLTEAGWFSTAQSQLEQIFCLSDASKQQFKQLQQEFSGQTLDSFDVGIQISLKRDTPDIDAVVASVSLQLSADDAYFTLIDAAEIELSETPRTVQ